MSDDVQKSRTREIRSDRRTPATRYLAQGDLKWSPFTRFVPSAIHPPSPAREPFMETDVGWPQMDACCLSVENEMGRGVSTFSHRISLIKRKSHVTSSSYNRLLRLVAYGPCTKHSLWPSSSLLPRNRRQIRSKRSAVCCRPACKRPMVPLSQNNSTTGSESEADEQFKGWRIAWRAGKRICVFIEIDSNWLGCTMKSD